MRGTLAEELQRAIDYAAGLHATRRINRSKKMHGDNLNDVSHIGVFNRIADTLVSSKGSLLNLLQDQSDAPEFRGAAAALTERLT